MLNADELAGMRETLGTSLAGTAIIQTQAYVSDGGGGGTTTWTNAGTADCRITPVASAGEGERVEGGRVHPDTQYIFTLPNDTAITDDSQILYGSQVFAVTSLRAPRTWEISRRVECKEVS